MLQAAKRKSSLSVSLTALRLLLLLVVACCGLDLSTVASAKVETRVWSFAAAPSTASGEIAFATPAFTGENYDALAYDASDSLVAAKTGANVGTQPNRIYSARELIRRAEEPGPFHNFPESFNQQIFENGTRTVTPNYFKVPKAGLSQDGVMYELRGSVNGVNGTFEIGVRPSVSGNTEVIGHRFFRPDP